MASRGPTAFRNSLELARTHFCPLLESLLVSSLAADVEPVPLETERLGERFVGHEPGDAADNRNTLARGGNEPGLAAGAVGPDHEFLTRSRRDQKLGKNRIHSATGGLRLTTLPRDLSFHRTTHGQLAKPVFLLASSTEMGAFVILRVREGSHFLSPEQ